MHWRLWVGPRPPQELTALVMKRTSVSPPQLTGKFETYPARSISGSCITKYPMLIMQCISMPIRRSRFHQTA